MTSTTSASTDQAFSSDTTLYLSTIYHEDDLFSVTNRCSNTSVLRPSWISDTLENWPWDSCMRLRIEFLPDWKLVQVITAEFGHWKTVSRRLLWQPKLRLHINPRHCWFELEALISRGDLLFQFYNLAPKFNLQRQLSRAVIFPEPAHRIWGHITRYGLVSSLYITHYARFEWETFDPATNHNWHGCFQSPC